MSYKCKGIAEDTKQIKTSQRDVMDFLKRNQRQIDRCYSSYYSCYYYSYYYDSGWMRGWTT